MSSCGDGRERARWSIVRDARGSPLEIVQALIVEAALIIAVTMLVCDLLQAALDPRLRAPA
jgi:ABC-type dipeptide/oligopeptide/nickel transport system permease component